jgi:hypothetical protein
VGVAERLREAGDVGAGDEVSFGVGHKRTSEGACSARPNCAFASWWAVEAHVRYRPSGLVLAARTLPIQSSLGVEINAKLRRMGAWRAVRPR